VPESINWIVKTWDLHDCVSVGSERTTRIDAFGAAVADTTEQLRADGVVGLVTGHHPETDVLLAWAEVHPSQVDRSGEQSLGHNVGAEQDLEELGSVRARHWRLVERSTLGGHADQDAAWSIGSEVAAVCGEERPDQDVFVSVHYPAEERIAGVGWHEPGGE
jgi:hypothetical protein